MRIKTLLLTAALSVATIATAKADVFSVNVVGYVNVTLADGFNLLGNPLVSSNNAIGDVLPSVPEGSVVYKLQPNGTFKTDLYAEGAWYDSLTEVPSTTTLAPGEGFFLFSTAISNITFVGEVKTGTNSVALSSGLSLVSSVVPQTYELIGADFPAADGDTHYRLVGTTYEVSIYDSGIGWYDSLTETPRQVNTEVAKGFFLFNAAAPKDWTRSFSVNN